MLWTQRPMSKSCFFYLLSKGNNISEPQVPHLSNGINTCLEGLSVEVAFMKCLAQYLALRGSKAQGTKCY